MNSIQLAKTSGAIGLIALFAQTAAAGIAAPQMPVAAAPSYVSGAIELAPDLAMLLWAPLLLAGVVLVAVLLCCIYLDSRKNQPAGVARPQKSVTRGMPAPGLQSLWRPATAAAFAWLLAVFGSGAQQGSNRVNVVARTEPGDAGGKIYKGRMTAAETSAALAGDAEA